MDKIMDQNILEAIQKSLPAMQMETLKKELEKAAKHDQLVKDLQASRDAHSKLILEHDALKKLEIEMRTEREKAHIIQRDFELKSAKHELECQKQITSAIKDLAYAAFRNPDIHKSYSIPVQNMGYTAPVSETITRT